MIRAAFLLALLFALTACTDATNGDGANPTTTAAAKKPVAHQKTVFDAQLKALDKAHGVQKTLDQDKARTDQAIKDSGG
ncbi:MAG: hypothetical protein WB784_13205 [Rhodanobacteraceae bacterium]